MGTHAATCEIPPPESPGTAALQHGPWTAKGLLSRVLAVVERFLSGAEFERAPWVTVAFATGIIAWFWLPSAPAWAGLCGALVAICAICYASFPLRVVYPHLGRALSLLPLVVVAGCLVVWARSELVGQPAIERPLSGNFSAQVLAIESQPALGRDRLLLAMRDPLSGSGHDASPGNAIKVRLNVPGKGSTTGIAVGDLVAFRARLMPPAPPMLPGAYNFARTSWFTGIAASGSVTGEVKVVRKGKRSEWGLLDIRQSLTNHIRARIGDERAGIAAAFVTGDRGGITEADDQAMRDSGLAHLLSISGLHVSAMVGAVYLLVIRLLALFPWVALRVRLPVVAAGAGAAAGVAYTLLSGSEVPTVRSCIGSLLVLIALALGREPLSLRMLAVAAFCVLLLWPEAVIGPSFQLSFGAVLALIAVSTAKPVRHFLGPRDEGLAMTGLRHLSLLLLTGVVIDLALMPIGLYHFHRAGVYGALANVAAIPLSTFVVMPLLACALVLDIAGLGGPVWWLAGISIDLLVGLARWFASRPGAVNLLPGTDTWAFLLFVAGGLWMGLWSGRIRWAGLPIASVGVFLLATAPAADMLVSGDGRHVGLVEDGGKRLYLLRNSESGYARDNLMEFAGIEADPVTFDKFPGARCNRDFCALPVRRSGTTWHVLVSRGRDAVAERSLAAACERSDIVISDRWLPRSCKPRWFKADRGSLGQTGGLAVYLGKARIDTVAQTQGEHGWWRPRPVHRYRNAPAPRKSQ
ncbi:ComEC/Rec2 family competence protein [Novosphingobium sp. HR1a]|uniref:ComEC/Rec2 family competence protein n=1 Tax=Novosphingobium sp. HR1a TaxID=1395637 RepID=UPI002003B507|nr:ComEC/Rec2 family competence protein [Novosphingobium sp. HR1a]